jgi:hypothetical protein
MVLVYKNLQNWVILGKGFFVGGHIPAPWFANLGLGSVIINQRILKAPSHGDTTVLGNHAGFKSAKSHVCCIFETVQLYFLT